MEVASLVLAIVSAGPPLGNAILGLRQVYQHANDIPASLKKLEHTGETIRLYLSKLDDEIKRSDSGSGSPAIFARWLEEEKVVLDHLITEIHDFTTKVRQRLQIATVLAGATLALEGREISGIERGLRSHLGVLDCMWRVFKECVIISLSSSVR